jgi:HSP20 family protein
MASLIPWKQKRKTEGDGGAMMPFGEFPFFMSRMREEFDRMLERFSRAWPGMKEGFEEGWRWGLDVQDEENAIIIRAEAPGFEAGDFDLQIHENQLVLRATRKVETKDEKGKIRETRQQECFESVTLPSGIDHDRITARYHNGVLTVTLPKTAAGKGKHIPVKNA